jgi:L-alanine-DL-glutamate epimerase-like enolase superfamily enzyme
MTPLEVDVCQESWPILGSFTISRGSKSTADVIVVTLARNGVRGRGEAVPYPRYGETPASCIAALADSASTIKLLSGRAAIGSLALPAAARNALDCAFWDLECKESGVPAWQRAGLPTPGPLTTAYTISLASPEAMARAAEAAAERPLLKIKLGRDGDKERIDAVRKSAPSARLLVDANEGWSPENVEQMLELCSANGVELVEQPLPASGDDMLRSIKRPLPVCADESVHQVAGLMALRGKYDAINIKLDKTGGLTQALLLAQVARQEGFRIMAGCMLATSLAMAPAFLIGQLADWADLDGPLLLARDRVPGITYAGNLMMPPPRLLWG